MIYSAWSQLPPLAARCIDLGNIKPPPAATLETFPFPAKCLPAPGPVLCGRSMHAGACTARAPVLAHRTPQLQLPSSAGQATEGHGCVESVPEVQRLPGVLADRRPSPCADAPTPGRDQPGARPGRRLGDCPWDGDVQTGAWCTQVQEGRSDSDSVLAGSSSSASLAFAAQGPRGRGAEKGSGHSCTDFPSALPAALVPRRHPQPAAAGREGGSCAPGEGTWHAGEGRTSTARVSPPCCGGLEQNGRAPAPQHPALETPQGQPGIRHPFSPSPRTACPSSPRQRGQTALMAAAARGAGALAITSTRRTQAAG